MSDDHVQQVIEELDPTPAHEAAWPVSRRQTLRALAAAGLVGAGSGSASAESVGGVIADEAVFSNYGSESVSDGWELTIDDDVFALTESDTETIGLPDGSVGEEVVLPSGNEASEMIAPDGSVVWEAPFDGPDSVVSLLEFEDDSDTATAIDSVGTFDHTINGATYTTTSAVGDQALDYDGSGDFTKSDTAVDLVSNGTTDEASIMAWMNADSTDNSSGYIVANGDVEDTDAFGIQDQGGSVRGVVRASGNITTTSSVSVPVGSYEHVYLDIDASTLRLIVGGSSGTVETASIADDVSTLGEEPPHTGGGIFSNYFPGQIDDVAFANAQLSDSELDDMVARGE